MNQPRFGGNRALGALRSFGVLVGLGMLGLLAAVAVYLSGRTVLTPPNLVDPGSWSRWLSDVGPVVGVFAIARIVLLATCALWVLTAVCVASATFGGPGAGLGTGLGIPLLRLLRRLHLPGATRMLTLAIGLSVSATALAACGAGPPAASAGPAAASADPQVPVLVNPRTPSLKSPSPRTPVVGSPAISSPTSSITPAEAHAPSTSGATAAAGKASQATPSGGLWVVRPGDDLWSIAADTMQLRLGRLPTRGEVAAYWLEVIEANRDRLPYPNDPSLLYAGDLIALPTG